MKTLSSLLVTILLFAVCNINSIFAANNDWIQVSSGNNEDYLAAIQFVTPTIGYIAGTRGLILKTTDGGNSWITKTTGLSSQLNCVYFINAQTGIAAGSFGRIVRTTNGGDSWTQLTSPTGYMLDAISFANSTVGYISGANCVLLKTEDAGLTWTKKGSTEVGAYWDCYFFNATTGIVLNMNYNIRKTTNSGDNWNNVYIPPMDLSGLSFINSTTGFACGSDGLIVKTTNSGDNWLVIQGTGTGYTLLKMCFYSETIGFAVGKMNSNGTGVIVKTGNRGDTWTLDANLTVGLNALACNNGYMFAVGDSGKIYRSVNIIGIQNISSEIPSGYKLGQNYPNPFNPVTNIEFALPKSGNVKVSIFDITGKTIQVLVNQFLQVGSYKYDFHAENLSSGVYFYRIETNGFVDTKKMTLIK